MKVTSEPRAEIVTGFLVIGGKQYDIAVDTNLEKETTGTTKAKVDPLVSEATTPEPLPPPCSVNSVDAASSRQNLLARIQKRKELKKVNDRIFPKKSKAEIESIQNS